MNLASAVARESGVAVKQVMLLRHANGKVAALFRAGGQIEEYTLVQPTDSKYDFRATGRPPIKVVAVIVNDHVFALYEIPALNELARRTR